MAVINRDLLIFIANLLL